MTGNQMLNWAGMERRTAVYLWKRLDQAMGCQVLLAKDAIEREINAALFVTMWLAGGDHD